MVIPLSQIPLHQTYRIDSLQVSRRAEALHLSAMGLCKTAEIKRIQRTPFGDPVEYLVDGEHLIALENSLAAQIFVEEIPEHAVEAHPLQAPVDGVFGKATV